MMLKFKELVKLIGLKLENWLEKTPFAKYCFILVLLILITAPFKDVKINVNSIRMSLTIALQIFIFIIISKLIFNNYRKNNLLDSNGKYKNFSSNKLAWWWLKKIFFLFLLFFIFITLLLSINELTSILGFNLHWSGIIFSDLLPIIYSFLLIYVTLELLRLLILDGTKFYVNLLVLFLFVILVVYIGNEVYTTFFISTVLVSFVNLLNSTDTVNYIKLLKRIPLGLDVKLEDTIKEYLLKLKFNVYCFSLSYSTVSLLNKTIFPDNINGLFKDFLVKFFKYENGIAQEISNSFTILFLIFSLFLVLKKFINYLLKSGDTKGIPVLGKIIQYFNKKIDVTYTNLVNEKHSSNEIELKYYINKFHIYGKNRKQSYVYLLFNEDGVLKSYILENTYRELSPEVKEKMIVQYMKVSDVDQFLSNYYIFED